MSKLDDIDQIISQIDYYCGEIDNMEQELLAEILELDKITNATCSKSVKINQVQVPSNKSSPPPQVMDDLSSKIEEALVSAKIQEVQGKEELLPTALKATETKRSSSITKKKPVYVPNSQKYLPKKKMPTSQNSLARDKKLPKANNQIEEKSKINAVVNFPQSEKLKTEEENKSLVSSLKKNVSNSAQTTVINEKKKEDYVLEESKSLCSFRDSKKRGTYNEIKERSNKFNEIQKGLSKIATNFQKEKDLEYKRNSFIQLQIDTLIKIVEILIVKWLLAQGGGHKIEFSSSPEKIDFLFYFQVFEKSAQLFENDCPALAQLKSVLSRPASDLLQSAKVDMENTLECCYQIWFYCDYVQQLADLFELKIFPTIECFTVEKMRKTSPKKLELKNATNNAFNDMTDKINTVSNKIMKYLLKECQRVSSYFKMNDGIKKNKNYIQSFWHVLRCFSKYHSKPLLITD